MCHHPEQAARDKAVRDQIVAQLTDAVAGSDKLPDAKRTQLAAALRGHPAYRRFLRTTTSGKLRVDCSAVARDAKPARQVPAAHLRPHPDRRRRRARVQAAAGSRARLARHESTLDLRPVYHRLQDRIRAHVTLCWLALLLVRLAENATGDTWRNLRHELDRLHVGVFTGNRGRVLQRTDLTARQRDILRALDVAEPGRFLDITPA